MVKGRYYQGYRFFWDLLAQIKNHNNGSCSHQFLTYFREGGEGLLNTFVTLHGNFFIRRK